MSRKLVANLFYSVDGVAADPNLFQHDSFDDELAELMTAAISSIDENILGRVSYQMWADYWPTVTEGPDAGFAAFINGTPKHIASTTLTEVTWQNSRLITGDLLDHVRALKEAPGGDIAIQGSMSIVRQCVAAGLVDRLTLIMHPVIAGTGQHLFDGIPQTRLTLLEVAGTSKGNVVVTYGPRV